MQTQQNRHLLKRPGCLIGLFFWFVLLLTPCFMIFLAVRGEVAVQTGDVSEQQIRIWLIQEADQSGIGISTPMTLTSETAMCVEVHVNFLLWRGEADSTQYCTCYMQDQDGWQLISTNQGLCTGDQGGLSAID